MEEGRRRPKTETQLVGDEYDNHGVKHRSDREDTKRERQRNCTSKSITGQSLDCRVIDVRDKAGTAVKRSVGRLVLPLKISRAEEGLLGPLGVFQDVSGLDVHGGEAPTRGG